MFFSLCEAHVLEIASRIYLRADHRAKVCDLDVERVVEETVVRFQVAVDDGRGACVQKQHACGGRNHQQRQRGIKRHNITLVRKT